MSRARHMNRADGGKTVAYAGGDSNVMKEAKERKRGGKVAEAEGAEGMAHGGRKTRARKHGGRIGADKNPFTTAARIKRVTKGEQSEDDGNSPD